MPRFWFSKDSPSGRLTAISFALVLVGHVLVGSPHRAIPFESAAAAVRQAIQERAYARADELAYRLSRSIAASHGGASALAAQADALVVEVRIARGGAADADTLARAQRAVSTLAQQLGPDRPETIEAAFTLGRVQSARRDFTSALASHERVLAWRLRRLGRDAEAVADSLDESAVALLHLGRFDESEARLRDAIRIRESHAAESPLALARTSGLLGLHRRMNGQYAEAAEPLSRAMAIYRRVAPEDPEVISILQTNGDLALILGDPEAAQRTWADALDRVVRTFGEQHHAAADLLRRLGLAAFSLGSLAEGRELRQRALAIAEWTLAPCDFTRVDFMNDVAISLQYDGEYTEARALHQRALAALQRCDSAPAADSLATVLFNDASVAAQMGETADAETQYERAITIWKTNFGEAHPFVATGLDALASLIAPRQRPRARELFEEALAVRRRALGASHPLVAWTLANSAWVISELGEHHEALSRIDRAVEILSRTPPADEPDHLARVLEIRAAVEARHGNRRAARESLAGALGARERVFGAQHPLTAESRSRLAISDYMLGRAGPALDLALSAERAGLEHLRFTMRYLSERQALAYAARRPSGLDLALSIAVSSPTTVGPGRIADALVRSRRVILDELAARTRGAASVDESGDPEAQAVTAAGRRFANLLVRSLDEPVPRSLLESARLQKEEAERSLAQRNADARTELDRLSIGFDQVRAALPEGSVLVSFVQFGRVRPGASMTTTSPTPSMLALIARAASPDPTIVDLGSSDRIERDVAAWRAEASGGSLLRGVERSEAERRYDRAGAQLHATVWAPIVRHLRDVERVFLVPDGPLSLVAFAALPTGDRSFLADQVSVHYLSAERDLVGLDRSQHATRGLLAVGGAAFDGSAPGPQPRPVAPGGPSDQAQDLSVGGGDPCPGFRRLAFEPLAGTLDEAQELAAQWRESQGRARVRLLAGVEATESAVKVQAPMFSVLHLATHGFFLDQNCAEGRSAPASSGQLTRGVGGLSASARTSVHANPLRLSGLAFSGANRRVEGGPDDDDGVLTAEEVANLDLSGVEWAVLSACDTGVGEIKAGEGVFGLRRAFQVAGARTVIMSLWSVDDQATRAWMRALYEGRFQRQLSTADAVHQASLTVLRDRRARGQSTHPFFWAAFVAAGDWR